MHRSMWMWLVTIILFGCAAQDEAEPMPRQEPRTQVEEQLYPAELVMDHQQAIGLTEAQRAAIRAELQNAQRELVDAELELRAHRETLAQTLAPERVDEDASMQAAARVADGERAIKLSHLRMLVRIKNQLTPEQQRALERLR